MSRSFTYTKVTGYRYCLYSDDWEQDGIDFNYEVSDSKLLKAIVNMIYDEYFEPCKLFSKQEDFEKIMKDQIRTLIEQEDILDILVENYEESLKEIFEQEALEHYV